MKDRFLRWLRDPLVHFVVAAAALFVLLPGGTDIESERIEVSREDLIGFMQARARIYDERTFAEAYDALSPADRSQLFDDYVRQEALYREARAIRLDEADPLVRSRLVQQMELMLRDGGQGDDDVSDEEVRVWFDENQAEYAIPARASLTHVFFDRDRHGDSAEQLARAELQRLQQGDVPPEDAIAHGDRFPYQRNYSGMAETALVPELGEELARAAFTVPVGEWSGPFASPLGYHLLHVIDRSDGTTPALDSIRALVAEDALRAKRTERGRDEVQQLLDRYQVVPASDVGELAR